MQQTKKAKSYDALISWIGANRGHQLANNTCRILIDLLNCEDVSKQRLSHLRVAIDGWVLSKTGPTEQEQQDNNNQDENIQEGTRINKRIL